MGIPLYERIGGEAAVKDAVALLYRKVIADDRLIMFYEGVNMTRQKVMLELFLTKAFGGPNKYDGRALRAVHQRLVDIGLSHAHFDAMAEHLSDTLKELSVPKREAAEVLAVAESVRADVLCLPEKAEATAESAAEEASGGRSIMKKAAVLLYGTVSYAIFFATFLYAIGFVGNILVPKSIDAEPTAPLTIALVINGALLGIFAIQHSVMARPAFKEWCTQYIAEPIERSTYVLLSSLAMILMFALWQPIGGTIWEVTNPVAQYALFALFASGWLLVLLSTFLLNHFDLFGLRQVWLYARGKEYTALPFGTPFLYKHMRHPLYTGWFLAFWATPHMTATHLFFAVVTTVYIIVAAMIEEGDLVAHFGQKYVDYKRAVPAYIPRVFGRKKHARNVAQAESTVAH